VLCPPLSPLPLPLPPRPRAGTHLRCPQGLRPWGPRWHLPLHALTTRGTHDPATAPSGRDRNGRRFARGNPGHPSPAASPRCALPCSTPSLRSSTAAATRTSSLASPVAPITSRSKGASPRPGFTRRRLPSLDLPASHFPGGVIWVAQKGGL